MNKLTKFLEDVDIINKSIDLLLEDGIIIKTPNGTNTVKEKYTVIEDGSTAPNDGSNYIELEDSKKYNIDAEVGDIIDVPVINFEDMSEEDIGDSLKEMLDNGDVTWDDIKKIAGASTSGKIRRTAVGAIKVGPKLIVGAGKIMLLRGLKKKIPHSSCFCAKLFEDNIDAGTSKPSRGTYESELITYIDTVKNQFLSSWDECEKNYDEYIKDETKRQKTLDTCVSLEDWYTDAKAVLNSIISGLQKYYNIKGIDVKKVDLKGGSEKSIAKTIGGYDKVELHFEKDVSNWSSPPGILFANSSTKSFTIGTYIETGETVRLELGRDVYYFQFQKTGKGKMQTGSVWKDDGSGKPMGNPVSWKGYITKFT
ncbi:MAG: hypothetical protein ACXADW_11530 [Candidatus Hodarchaeales archaeon]|jgi:hypothetical protein